MPKVVEIRTEPAICSIPLHLAVYCETATRSLTLGPIAAGFVVVKRFCR